MFRIIKLMKYKWSNVWKKLKKLWICSTKLLIYLQTNQMLMSFQEKALNQNSIGLWFFTSKEKENKILGKTLKMRNQINN